jgi:hypothetical protein
MLFLALWGSGEEVNRFQKNRFQKKGKEKNPTGPLVW